MKCIKNKCKYFKQDSFKKSYFRCALSDRSMLIYGEPECSIDDIITKKMINVNRLSSDRDEISKKGLLGG